MLIFAVPADASMRSLSSKSKVNAGRQWHCDDKCHKRKRSRSNRRNKSPSCLWTGRSCSYEQHTGRQQFTGDSMLRKILARKIRSANCWHKARGTRLCKRQWFSYSRTWPNLNGGPSRRTHAYASGICCSVDSSSSSFWATTFFASTTDIFSTVLEYSIWLLAPSHSMDMMQVWIL